MGIEKDIRVLQLIKSIPKDSDYLYTNGRTSFAINSKTGWIGGKFIKGSRAIPKFVWEE